MTDKARNNSGAYTIYSSITYKYCTLYLTGRTRKFFPYFISLWNCTASTCNYIPFSSKDKCNLSYFFCTLKGYANCVVICIDTSSFMSPLLHYRIYNTEFMRPPFIYTRGFIETFSTSMECMYIGATKWNDTYNILYEMQMWKWIKKKWR